MRYRMLLMVVLGGLLSGCATNSDIDAGEGNEQPDHFESFNRAMFNVNYNYLDPYVLRPAAVFWQSYIPSPVRTGVSNFSSNLEEPFSAVNYLLQGEPRLALARFNRFFLNSFWGIGGLFDIAALSGDPVLRKEHSYHFGYVLSHYGMGYGPYVVLPGLGSVTPRQDIGGLVDSAYPPLYWLVGWPGMVKWVIDGIDTRARFLDQDQMLKDSSDPYIFMREAYFQRHNFIASGGKISISHNVNEQYIQADLDEIDSY